MIYPFLRVISISLSSVSAIDAGLVTLLPKGVHFSAYRIILARDELWTAYRNTVFYVAGGVFLTLSLTSLMAYPLSVPGFLLRKHVTIYLAITMFFGGGLIPTYLVIKALGLINTYAVMVLPGCVGAFSVIIYRTFFQRLPAELRDSALMDGANDIVILFRIIIPLSKALLAAFGLFAAVGIWNQWFNALMYLRDDARYPVQMILRRFVILEELEPAWKRTESVELMELQRLHPKNLQMAVVVVTMLPILCVYPFIQRHFVKGVMIGSLKG